MKKISLYSLFLFIILFTMSSSGIQTMHFKTLMHQKELDDKFIKNIFLIGAGLGIIITIDYAYNKINPLYQSYKYKKAQALKKKLNDEKKLIDQKELHDEKKLNDQKKLNDEKQLHDKRYKLLPYSSNIKVFGGKNNYEEYIDIKEKCLIAQNSFKNLIKSASEQKRPFILAVATTQENPESTSFQHSYFDASYLCEFMLEPNTFARKKDTYFSQHITFKKQILKLEYFSIDSLTNNFRYVGNETTCLQNTNESLLLKLYIIMGLENGDYLNEYGLFCYNNNNLTYAEISFKNAIQRYNNRQAINNLGNVYYRKNNLIDAIKCYEEASNKYDNIVSLYNLGIMYKNTGNHDIAKKYFQEAFDRGYQNAEKELLN